MGIRSMQNHNVALIAKLGWQMVTHGAKLWVQLIRSKYLRGRWNLSLEYNTQQASWIWKGISSINTFLQSGLCIQLGKHSIASIRTDPWLYSTHDHRFPQSLPVPDSPMFIKDLLLPDGIRWNRSLIQASFPTAISNMILHTPILDQEQDTLVWAPSTIGTFTVSFAYR